MTTTLRGKVLLTGASGFIGRRLRDRLATGGADVVSIRRKASPAGGPGRSVEADYDDLGDLERIVREEKPDYVLHVAGVTKGVTYDDFRRGNVMPTENLLRAVRKEHPGLRRFVLVSSLSSYGPATRGRPVEESDPKSPVEFYGRSKMEAEAAVEVDRSIPWTIARPSGVYGPGDVDYLELFKSAHRGLNAYFGNEHRATSIIYVDDCVERILQCGASDAAVHRGYFLTDGVPRTWGDFQSEVVRQTPRRVLTLRLPEAIVTVAAHGGELLTKIDGKPRLFNKQKAIMGAQEAWTCSGAAAARDLGDHEHVAMPEGIARTYAWYRSNGWL